MRSSPSPLLPLLTPANAPPADWRTKGVEGWAKEWFTTNLVGVEAEGVRVDSVTDVEGDAELGMRKSK